MQNGYSICFNRWALDKEIKNELNLLLIISSLCAREGYCYASNKYLAELFNITEISISNKIKKLEKENYIEIEYEKRGCEVISRKIRLKNILIDDYKKIIPTIKKDFKDNNINNNNTSINNIKENVKRKYGKYGRVKLTDREYCRLLDEYGKDFIEKQIELLDEYIQSNNNKNKYTDFNLVLRKSIRNNWFNNKQKDLPEWFNKDIEKEEINKEDKEYLDSLLKSYK